MSASSAMLGVLRFVVRSLLVALVLFWFGFALLSGAARYDEGIGAVLRNLPNALPWLALLAIVFVAFRWELAGGLLIVLAGVVSVVFFNALASPVVLITVSLPLVVLGCALILCRVLSGGQAP